MNPHDLDWVEVLLSRALTGARSLTVWLMLKNNEWDQLVNLTCDPSEYLDYNQEQFTRDYQATELFRKIASAPTSYDTKAEAIKAFMKAEDDCLRTNKRLLPYLKSRESVMHYNTKQWVHEFIDIWCSEIRQILKRLPETIDFKFSSGSTYDDRRYITPMDKMTNRPTMYAHSRDIIVPFWDRTLWKHSLVEERPYRSQPRIIRGDRFTTVPKTAKTDRGICIGASLNVTSQLGVGSVIRSRLRRSGLDIINAQDKHKNLVRLASMTKELATIDLSSASDTIAYNLVKLILPSGWFDLLDSLRARETCIDGKWHQNAKFSAMGNGYTFELETLIFYTLCTTVAIQTGEDLENISVYGDDIICPRGMAAKVIDALLYFGFTPNKRKTYIGDVPFRESCGADYFNGVPCRGYNLEEIPTNPQQWITLANGIRRMAKRDIDAHGDLSCYTPAWLRIINHIPAAYRNFGPIHLGDIVIHTDDKTWWRTRVRGQQHELRVLTTYFTDASYSRVDRKFWSRGAIIAAAVNGSLKGSGLKHVIRKDGMWGCYDPQFLLSNPKISGFGNAWISFSLSNDYPAWVRRPCFGF